jgi:hypothetical protein
VAIDFKPPHTAAEKIAADYPTGPGNRPWVMFRGTTWEHRHLPVDRYRQVGTDPARHSVSVEDAIRHGRETPGFAIADAREPGGADGWVWRVTRRACG